MAPLNPRAGRPYMRLVAHIHARETHCHLCGEWLNPALKQSNHPLAPTVDHLRCLNDGGDPLDPDNCRLACRCCNTSRGAKPLTPAVYARCRQISSHHRNTVTPEVIEW